MDKKKLLSTLALAGVLTTGVLGANVNATTVENYVKPVGVYKKIVQNKTVVPYVLKDRTTPITVKDIKAEFKNVTKVHESEEFSENDVIKTGSTFTANGIDYTAIVYGDVNSDGKVTTADARLIQKMVLNSELQKDEVTKEAADVRHDGKITTGDARAVQQVVLNNTMTKPSLAEEDNIAPALRGVPMEKVYVNLNSEYTLPEVTAVDDYDGEVEVSHEGEVNTAEAGEYEVTYTAKDRAGNEASQTFTVVVDGEGPTLSGITDGEKVYVKAGDSYTLPEVTATDTVDGNIDVTCNITKVVDEEKEEVDAIETSEDGIYEVTYNVKDSMDNEASAVLTVVIDGTAPTKADVKYSTTGLVSGMTGVKVTIESNEELQELEGWTLSEDKLSLSKTYHENVENEKIVIKDLAGNEKEAYVNISNIDEGVEAQVSYSPDAENPTNGNVTVTISSDEELQEVEGWTLAADKMSMTNVYETNVIESVVVKDLIGNETTAQINIQHIDRKAPTAEVKFDVTELTKGPVQVTLIASEKLQSTSELTDAGWTLAEDAMSMTKTYNANAEETLTIKDLAGNTAEIPVTISNIDVAAPELEVIPDITASTNKNVTVTIQGNEKLQAVEGWTLAEDKMSMTKVYEENTSEEVTVYDLVGNSAKATVTISNIDKEAPKVEGFTEGKNSYKTVTPTFTEGKAVLQKGDESSKEYISGTEINADGSYTLTVTDAAGNSTVKTFTIDNVAPVFETLEAITLKRGDNFDTKVIAEDGVDGEIEATLVITYNGETVESIDTTGEKDGQYTLTYTVEDAAGNTATATRQITVDATPARVESLQSSNPNAAKEVTMYVSFNEKMQLQEGWEVADGDAQTKFTKKYTANATETVEFKDIAGNITSVVISINNIDSDAPSALVSYSTSEATNQDVTVTVTAGEELQLAQELADAGWTLAENKMSMTKVYTANQTETVTISDLAGNTANVEVKVTNIDKTNPVGSVDYSTSDATKEDVTVTITATNGVDGEAEQLKAVEGWTLSNDKTSLTKTYSQNTEAAETITITDLAGNSVEVTVNVTNIDKAAPEFSGFTEDVSSYQSLTLTFTDTNAPITTIYQKDNEAAVTTTLNSGETQTFDAVGSYKLTVKDSLGNEVTKLFDIDKTEPTITGVEEGKRYKEATPEFTEGIAVLNTVDGNGDIISTVNYTSGTTIKNNGNYRLVVTDAAGNAKTVNFTIDNEGPRFENVEEKTYTTDVTPNATTNGTISKVTLTKDGETVESYTLNTAISEDGTYVLTVEDEIGNASSITFSIDKTGPQVEGFTEGQDVYKEVTPVFTEAGATATLKIGADEPIEFTSGTKIAQEGSYTLTVTDVNGNNTVIDFTIDITGPELTGVTEAATYNSANLPTPQNSANDVKTIELLKDGELVDTYTTLAQITEDGVYKLTVKDEAGNSTVVNFKVDTTVKGVQQIASNNGQVTNENVIVTISAEEELQEVTGWNLSSDKRTLTKEFTANETEEVTVKDLAGNTKTISVEVTGIDKEAPTVTDTAYKVKDTDNNEIYYTITDATKGPVYVTITASEELQLTEELKQAGWALVEGDSTKLTKEFTTNATEEVTLKDLAGNAIEVPADITLENIYHVGPTIEGIYEEETKTLNVSDTEQLVLPEVTAKDVKDADVAVTTKVEKTYIDGETKTEVIDLSATDGKLSLSTLCTYKITYQVADAAGNVTTQVRIVNVVAK